MKTIKQLDEAIQDIDNRNNEGKLSILELWKADIIERDKRLDAFFVLLGIHEKELYKGWHHFCNCINFGDSYLDADAIRFMNEFGTILKIKELKKQLDEGEK